MTNEDFKRALETYNEKRKKLEEELTLLDKQKEEDRVKYLAICRKLYELTKEFASL